uniref:Variant surface glycoprotein n=1 Tax=Trypanosoma brucei TaxID=5691 RepID=A0A1V0FYV7_9TRYP|nr:variant surface glycoprotein [Trypanosoma brucei]
MQAIQTPIATLLLYMTIVSSTKKAEANNHAKSAHVFFTLCSIYRNVDRMRNQDFKPLDADADYKEILVFNMSTADSDWQQLFSDDSTANTWQAKSAALKSKDAGINWEDVWDHWRNSAKAIKDDKTPWGKKWAGKKDDPRSPQVKVMLEALASEAHELLMAEKIVPQVTTKPLTKEITEAAEAVLCGGKTSWNKPNPGCTEPAASECTKTTLCTDSEAGKSLSQDMICLCLTNTNSECILTAGGSSLASGGSYQAGGWTDLLSNCPRADTDESAATKLRHDLAALQAQIGHGKSEDGAVILGSEHTTNCHNPASACVNYGKHYTKEKKGFVDIPWAKQLQTLLVKQELLDSAAADNKKRKERLSQLAKTAAVLYESKLDRIDVLSKTERSEMTDTKAPKETKCTKKNTTAAECPSEHCHYDCSKNKGMQIQNSNRKHSSRSRRGTKRWTSFKWM